MVFDDDLTFMEEKLEKYCGWKTIVDRENPDRDDLLRGEKDDIPAYHNNEKQRCDQSALKKSIQIY